MNFNDSNFVLMTTFVTLFVYHSLSGFKSMENEHLKCLIINIYFYISMQGASLYMNEARAWFILHPTPITHSNRHVKKLCQVGNKLASTDLMVR